MHAVADTACLNDFEKHKIHCSCSEICQFIVHISGSSKSRAEWGGGGEFFQFFAEYGPLATQKPRPTIISSVANFRTHLSHF